MAATWTYTKDSCLHIWPNLTLLRLVLRHVGAIRTPQPGMEHRPGSPMFANTQTPHRPAGRPSYPRRHRPRARLARSLLQHPLKPIRPAASCLAARALPLRHLLVQTSSRNLTLPQSTPSRLPALQLPHTFPRSMAKRLPALRNPRNRTCPLSMARRPPLLRPRRS